MRRLLHYYEQVLMLIITQRKGFCSNIHFYGTTLVVKCEVHTRNFSLHFKLERECEIDNVRKTLLEHFKKVRKQHMLQKLNLKTYAPFKHSFGIEKYVSQTLSRSCRSFLA